MLAASVFGDQCSRPFQSQARRANCMSEILHSLDSNGDSGYLAGEEDELNLRALEIDFRADPRWRPFVAAHPDGTAYHHPLWLEALEKEYGQRIVTLACESGDALVDRVPLADFLRFRVPPLVVRSQSTAQPALLSCGPRSSLSGKTQGLDSSLRRTKLDMTS
jgi:hypothetical protein